MPIHLCALAGAIISLFPASAAFADANNPSDSVATKVEIAVARYDQRRQDTATTFVVEHDELVRHGDRTLADALKRLPGITTGDRNGRGSEIRMRGLGSGYTQILLNGVAAPAGFALESIAPDLIERIEIARTASAETSMQAIAGTINIVLKKTAARARNELKLGLGMQGGRYSSDVGGQVSGKGEGYAYTLAGKLGRVSTANPLLEEEIGIDGGGNLDLHRRTQLQESNRLDALNLSARVNWNLPGRRSLTSQTFIDVTDRTGSSEAHERTRVGVPSSYPHNIGVLRAFAPFLRSDLIWAGPFEEGGRIELKAGGNFSRRRSYFGFDGTSGQTSNSVRRQVGSTIRESGTHFSGKYTLPAGEDHALSFGWDTARADRTQTRLEHELVPSSAWRETGDDRYHGALHRWALFVQDEWTIDAAWSLLAGLRWESLRTSVEDRNAAPVVQRTAVASPVVQVLYKLSPERQWRAGLTRTWKAPTMVDLIPRRYTVDNNNSATKPDTQGNPALRPELAWGLDVVYDHYLGKDGLWSASAFVRRIDDVMLPFLFKDGSAWVSMPANSGKALVTGMALEAKFPLKLLMADAPAIDLRANLARNWSWVDAVPAPLNRLDSQIPVSVNLGIDYRPRGMPLTLGADFHFRGGGTARQSVESTTWNAASRNLDVYGLWTLDGKTRLRIGASNLLRRDRQSESRYRDSEGSRSALSTTPTPVTLRITLEHELGS